MLIVSPSPLVSNRTREQSLRSSHSRIFPSVSAKSGRGTPTWTTRIAVPRKGAYHAKCRPACNGLTILNLGRNQPNQPRSWSGEVLSDAANARRTIEGGGLPEASRNAAGTRCRDAIPGSTATAPGHGHSFREVGRSGREMGSRAVRKGSRLALVWAFQIGASEIAGKKKP